MSESSASGPGIGRWSTIAAEAKTLAGGPQQTIKRRDAPLDSRARAVLEQVADGRVTDGPRLYLKQELGRGGMGVVHLAEQVAMGRDVAVKAVLAAADERGPTLKLLQEAWTAGSLEHPNIVPVYDITYDEHGRPLIVLKRIEGESWADVLHDPDGARDRYRIEDWLEWNLQVLVQVCNAMHFAHDRGVVHLDLKPENVMIGRHGEVYVVDWGVALALDDGDGRLPSVSKHVGIVGTPSYMAPEMLDGDGARLGARTDVYLIGAILYELLAGRPPHQADTIMSALHAVLAERPVVPEDAPTELAAICRRAISRDPKRRWESALELRRAVQDFLRHRESGRLADEAAEALEQLQAQQGEAARLELFSRVRFGFEQALSSWPDNASAKAGLREAFERMVTLELDDGKAEAAAALAAQAPALPEELAARVKEAAEKRRVGLDELEARRRDADLQLGQRTRFFTFTVMGVLWTVTTFAAGALPAWSNAVLYAAYLGMAGAAMALLIAFRLWARESLTRTRVNRMAVVAVGAGLWGHAMVLFGGMVLGAPPEQVTPFLPLAWSLGAVTLAVAVDERGWWIVGAFTAAFFASVISPEHRFIAMGLGCFLCVVVVVIVWLPPRVRGEIPEPDHRA